MNESKRVRIARALDEIEKMVRDCGSRLFDQAMNSEHLQNELKVNVYEAIKKIADKHDVGFSEVKDEAMRMLSEEFNATLRGIACDVRYVKPYIVDGEYVGVQVKYDICLR